MRELAVVGEQQQAFGVGVQPSDVEELLVATHTVLHQVPDARPSSVIRHGGVHSRGLLIARYTMESSRTILVPSTDVGGLGVHPVPNSVAGRRPRPAVGDHPFGNAA